jgi:hypothetical protein
VDGSTLPVSTWGCLVKLHVFVHERGPVHLLPVSEPSWSRLKSRQFWFLNHQAANIWTTPIQDNSIVSTPVRPYSLVCANRYRDPCPWGPWRHELVCGLLLEARPHISSWVVVWCRPFRRTWPDDAAAVGAERPPPSDQQGFFSFCFAWYFLDPRSVARLLTQRLCYTGDQPPYKKSIVDSIESVLS